MSYRLTIKNVKEKLDGLKPQGDTLFRFVKNYEQAWLFLDDFKNVATCPIEETLTFEADLESHFSRNEATVCSPMNNANLLYFLMGGNRRLVSDNTYLSRLVNAKPSSVKFYDPLTKDLAYWKLVLGEDGMRHFVDCRKVGIPEGVVSLIDYIVQENDLIISNFCSRGSQAALRKLLREFAVNICDAESTEPEWAYDMKPEHARMIIMDQNLVKALSELLEILVSLAEASEGKGLQPRYLAEGLTWLLIASLLRGKLSSVQGELDRALRNAHKAVDEIGKIEAKDNKDDKTDSADMKGFSSRIYSIKDDFDALKLKAQSGDADAMFALACMYFYGISNDKGNSERQTSIAFEWFKKAINNNCSNTGTALQLIGHMFYTGIVPDQPQSYSKCIEYHEMAKKYSVDTTHLAYMRSNGIGCEFDYLAAEKTFMETIDSTGDVVSIFNLAKFYERYGHFKKAIPLYEKIYEVYPEAAVNLGKLYMLGLHLDDPHPDYNKAKRCLLEAVDSTYSAEANYLIGKLYFQSKVGSQKRFFKAMNYFRNAAKQGHMDANYHLGYMYYYGHCGRDLKKAIYYYTKAYELGSVVSAIDLAIIYQQPETLDYSLAFHYAEIAASAGILYGEYIFANLLFLGRGCARDVVKAKQYYNHLIKNNFMQAQFMLEMAEAFLNNDTK